MNRRTSLIVFFPIVIVMIVLDRLSKAWAVEALPLGTKNGPDLAVVKLTMVHNEGAAFGLGQGLPLVFVGIAAVILVIIVAWLAKGPKHGRLEVVSLALIAAGAVGNVIDRVAQGYVVDFLDFTFIDFPVFNVADICVTCGVVLFIVCVLFLMDFDMGDGEAQEIVRSASEPHTAEPQAAEPQAAEVVAAEVREGEGLAELEAR